MIRIGILGDIGSGKSYVANEFGYPVFDADFEVSKLYNKNKKIFCTQYHPELPFNFIGKLMNYWKKNYSKIFNNDEFENRLILLNQLEQENYFNRKLEIENWLKST